MDQHLLLIADWDDGDEDDNIIQTDPCPNCGYRHFWIDELRSNHEGMSITVYVCMDCGYQEELA
jgi:DNA-directed RNA polymerase subunit RPC12/RpoP